MIIYIQPDPGRAGHLIAQSIAAQIAASGLSSEIVVLDPPSSPSRGSDVASLGLAVDSSQVVKATSDIEKFADAAKSAVGAVNELKSASDRCGITFDEMLARLTATIKK